MWPYRQKQSAAAKTRRRWRALVILECEMRDRSRLRKTHKRFLRAEGIIVSPPTVAWPARRFSLWQSGSAGNALRAAVCPSRPMPIVEMCAHPRQADGLPRSATAQAVQWPGGIRRESFLQIALASEHAHMLSSGDLGQHISESSTG
jgi:hypothetical protein